MAKHTKRRDSWGSISYDPKTRTARIRYWAEGPDGYRRRSKTVRNCTRKEAEEARAQLLLDHGEDAACPTVAQAWERWVLPTYKSRLESGDVTANTFSQYKSAYKRHVEPRWGDVPCDQVRPLTVQQWISDGKTLIQARKGCGQLSTILDFAVRYEFIDSNVMNSKYVMPSKSTTRERDKEIWNLSQIGELWNALYGSFIEPAFIMSAFGSCRVGESLAPLGTDVERRTVNGVTIAVVSINKQIANKGRKVLHKLKTGSSERTVVFAGKAAERILGIAAKVGDGYLTNDGVGRPVAQNTLNYQWEKIVPPKLLHPYRNLRNSWQTYMRWELGIPPWLIEPMMGHVGNDVTGKYYDRPLVDDFCTTVAKAYAEHPYDTSWNWID